MQVVWEDVKRQANLAKHGLDFASVQPSYFVTALVRPSHSGRLLAIGPLNDDLVVAVVFRLMGREGVSLVSLRTASTKERRDYYERF